MSFLLRLCLGLVFLAPALAHASVLEIPGDGGALSGIGVISGWKCDADGDITVRFDDDEMLTVRMVYGSERGDTEETSDGKIICGDKDNGFLAIFNWALLTDGEHTAQAYDNGVPFGNKHTFTVTTTGEEFLTGASKCITVDNFPSDGETTYLEWNESTQHFEMVGSCDSPPDGPPSQPSDPLTCTVGLTVQPGEMCSGSVTILGSSNNYTFSVNADGQGCIDVSLLDRCFDLAEEFDNLLDSFGVDANVIKNADGSWTILELPN